MSQTRNFQEKTVLDDENEGEKFLSKILARDSYVYSSRIYYYNSGEGIPFKWEMQPGIAKEYQPKEELPPISPPPAVLSSGLPKPCIELIEPKPSTRSRLLYFFWKKNTRIGKSNKNLQEEYSSDDANNNGFDVFARLKCSSYSESMVSPRNSSFSSPSSLSLMKNRPESWWSTRSASTRKEIFGRPLGCFPVNISRILIPIARRD